MSYFVYILASTRYGTLYIGSTSDLVKRVWEHKQKVVHGFTSQYVVSQLVYYEQFDDPSQMVHRERRLKEWKRAWKISLIEQTNPRWKDLYEEILC